MSAPVDFVEAYKIVDRYIEERYRVISTICDVIDPNTGDFNGKWIKVDHLLDAESALFVLLHLFGHTVQWNIDPAFRKLGQETVNSATPEQLKQIYTYERQATQYGIQILHECGMFELDQWMSDFWSADWQTLAEFYTTGGQFNQFEVRQ